MPHRARIIAASAVFFLAPASVLGADIIASFKLPSGHKVTIVEAPFAEGKLKYSDSSPCLVDGRIPFGTDCGIPSTYVKSLSVVVNGKSLKLDTSQMFNVWGNRHLITYKGKPVRYFGGSCLDKEICVFRGLFSDGAGTFVAEWRVVNGATARTVVTSDEEFIALFTNNLDARWPK